MSVMIQDDLKEKYRGKVYFINPQSLYLPAIAENLAYNVRLNTSGFDENILGEVEEYNPDFLVADLSFQKFRVELVTLENIKKSLPSLKIIVTGEPFLTYNRNVTYENPYIDYVITGEAEYTLRDILDGVPDNEILGILYTDDSMQSIKNEPRAYIENLDELPLPARHLIDDNSSVNIELSRGCPCYCSFCLKTPIEGKLIRCRTVNSIINEIKDCVKKYNTKQVYFKSCFINYSKNFLKELCNAIIENGLKIKWSCDIFPNDIDEELVKIMKKSGCTLCKIGVETGSKEILTKLGRNITKESIKNTVELFKKYKIKLCTYFIIGFPDDSGFFLLKLSLMTHLKRQ